MALLQVDSTDSSHKLHVVPQTYLYAIYKYNLPVLSSKMGEIYNLVQVLVLLSIKLHISLEGINFSNCFVEKLATNKI